MSLGTEPRPLHNRDGTIRSLARQMLADLDREAVNTPVPTLTLELLLTRLCEALDTMGAAAPTPAVNNMLDQRSKLLAAPESNPNLAYWRAAADKDADRVEPDPPDEC